MKPINIKKEDVSSAKIIDENLTLLSVNCRSLNNKKSSIKRILESTNADFVCLQELNCKSMPQFPGHINFTQLSNKKFHGTSIVCKAYLKPRLMRIPTEKHNGFEVVHLILKQSVPTLHIFGLYVEVESRHKVEEVEESWNKLSTMIDDIIDEGEAVVAMGDWNRPVNPNEKGMSHGTKLLNNWLETGKVTMLNNPLEHTRVDPHTKKGSTLDLGVVSKNIEKCVKSFEVDKDKKWTPFAIRKRKGVAEKHFTDHRTIKMKLRIKSQKGGKGKNEKKRPVIDYQNKEGWLLYPLVADEYAEEMKRAIKKEKDPNDLMRRLKIIDTNIQLDSFGIK